MEKRRLFIASEHLPVLIQVQDLVVNDNVRLFGLLSPEQGRD
jgi:hypothetical protein